METPLAILFRETRLRLGISQTELAARCGFKGQSSVAEIERGIGTFRASKIPQVAKAIGVSEQAVKDAITATQIMLKGGGPPVSPYSVVVEFTPLEYKRVQQFARGVGLESDQPGVLSRWIRRVVLDFLAGRKL
jgi:transcriptional regulator with XRE-family HTH domain